MSGHIQARTLGSGESFSSAWPVILCTAMAGGIVVVFAVDPRTAVGFLAVLLSVLLLIVRIEWLAYAAVGATVIFVDGWLMTRSIEDTPFRMGIGRLYLMEIPIFLLFVAYLNRRWNAKKGGAFEGIFVSTPLDSPLRAWVIAFPIFAVYGLLFGHPLQDAVGYYEWRCLFIAILFYFLVTSLFHEYKDLRRLWRWFFVVASAKAFYSLVLAITKIDPPLPLVFGQGPVGEGPENLMVIFAALPALAVLLFHAEKELKWRALLLFGVLTMVANVALSEKRGPQLGLLIGLAVLGWHLPRREKIRWGFRIACLTLLFVIGAVLANPGSSGWGIGASLSRYNEITEFVQAPGENNAPGDTFAFHLFDIVDGWEKMKEHPLLGQGFGGQTERNLTLLPFAWGGDIDTGMVHNQYLTFWLKMGIAGPILMLLLLGRFFLYCRLKLNLVSQTFASAIVIGICAAVWADAAAMEFWGVGWIGNTKTPIVIFLNMALAVGFSRFCNDRTSSRFGEANA